MKVLSIDISGEVGAVALTKEDYLLGELTLEMKGSSLMRILAMIDYVLKSTHFTIRDIDLFSVVLGPGSWSGLRIGVTTAKSFAHALKKPVVGVSTLDVLAYNVRYADGFVYPVIDAKRGQVYFAEYRCERGVPQRLTDYRLNSIEYFVTSIKSPSVILGDACLKYQEEIISGLGDVASVAPSSLSQTRAAFVNEAGLHRYMRSGADDTLSLAPFYLQESDAERAWALKHSHSEQDR